MRDEDARAGGWRYAGVRLRKPSHRLVPPSRRATFRLLSDGGVMAQGAGGLMVSVSGIRGRVGEALTPEVVARYAAAFGAWALAQGGLDAGSSSGATAACPARCSTASSWAPCRSVGCDVIDIGLTTTPDAASSPSSTTTPPAALMLSASHNPIEWNALKLHRAERAVSRGAPRAPRCARSLETGIPRATWDRLGAVDAGRPDAARGTSTPCWRSRSRRRGDPARAGSRSRSTACAARAPTIMPALLERSAARWSRSTWSRTAAFRASRSRSPRTLASSKRSCARAGRTSGSRSIRTSTGWRSSVDEGRAIGEDYTLALAARLVLRHRGARW